MFGPLVPERPNLRQERMGIRVPKVPGCPFRQERDKDAIGVCRVEAAVYGGKEPVHRPVLPIDRNLPVARSVVGGFVRSAARRFAGTASPKQPGAKAESCHWAGLPGVVFETRGAVWGVWVRREGSRPRQAGVLALDLISQSSTASRSSTCSQPQIMARVWALRL